MTHTFQKHFLRGVLFLCLLASSGFVLPAQNSQPMNGPPNVLVIQREFLKPGKGGAIHERSESAFVKAMRDADYPTHYFAMDSMSGPSRSLFLIAYNSFAEWEKDNLALQKNKILAAAVDHAALMDGELLSSYDTTVMFHREDLSLNPIGLQGVRYFEINQFYVKPGKQKEFEDAAKMYVEGYRKVPGSHWDMYQMVYGLPPGAPAGSAYLVIMLLKSLSETDQGMLNDTKFSDVMGAGGMTKLNDLIAESTTSWTTNLFALNPRMSYPYKQWVDADPGFWQMPATIPAKKPTKAPPATP